MKFLPVFLKIISALPLTLSADDNFAEATPIDFLTAQATETINGTNAAATAEDGEPAHAGVTASASLWYALTVDAKRRVELTARPGATGPLSSIVMAVYTGDSLANLQTVKRYKKIALPATSRSFGTNGEPFVAYARLSFDAKPGTTYFVAIDGENNSKGAFDLTLATSRDLMTPRFEAVPAKANWSYYQALTGTNASDPSTADTDFYTTWHTVATYDGPAFLGPAPAPFSYGTINGEPNRGTGLVTPVTAQRQAVTYFRTTFTPKKGVQGLGFEGAIDDGAAIYINGVEVARLNVNPGTLIFNSTAVGAAFNIPIGGTLGTEEEIQYAIVSGLDLPADQEVEVGVSLHNASGTSSDSGFHMRVYATEADPDPIQLNFQSTSVANSYRLFWLAEDGSSYDIESSTTSLDAASWVRDPRGPFTATEDGILDEFVSSSTPVRFWRIVTIPSE